MDLSDLSTVSADELSDAQLRGILAQIDLDITNLLRDGKLAALKYNVGGADGPRSDRAANLLALIEARKLYQELLSQRPAWVLSQAATEPDQLRGRDQT